MQLNIPFRKTQSAYFSSADHAIDTCRSTCAAVARTILCTPCPALGLVSTATSPASRNASTSRLTALRSRFNRVAIAVIDPGSSFTALKTTGEELR